MSGRGKLKVLDLFSGIGGFSLGLERTGGFETVAFCEIDPFCRRVLAKHWPSVPCFEDVTTLRGESVGPVDVICGGFPCQDISLAGLGAGMDGARSGLWSEYARLIGELRPVFILVENVAALLGRGLDRVLRDLASLGYDAEWHCIPASAVGAPHRRDRVWILAYANSGRGWADAARGDDADWSDTRRAQANGLPGEVRQAGREASVADASGEGHRHFDAAGEDTRAPGPDQSEGDQRQRLWPQSGGGGANVPDANQIYAQGLLSRRNDTIVRREQIERQARLCSGAGEHQDWSVEPAVGRVAHGVPDRVGQLRAYGNAVVPQIPELIGNAILESMRIAA